MFVRAKQVQHAILAVCPARQQPQRKVAHARSRVEDEHVAFGSFDSNTGGVAAVDREVGEPDACLVVAGGFGLSEGAKRCRRQCATFQLPCQIFSGVLQRVNCHLPGVVAHLVCRRKDRATALHAPKRNAQIGEITSHLGRAQFVIGHDPSCSNAGAGRLPGRRMKVKDEVKGGRSAPDFSFSSLVLLFHPYSRILVRGWEGIRFMSCRLRAAVAAACLGWAVLSGVACRHQCRRRIPPACMSALAGKRQSRRSSATSWTVPRQTRG